MKLKVRMLELDASGKPIVIINSEDARELGVYPLERIVLINGRKRTAAVVNITKKFVKMGEIIVYDEVKEILGLRHGQIIDAEPRKELLSKNYIRKKIDGGEMNYKETKEIVEDVIARNLNDLELASFLTALHIRGMSMSESIAMASAMIDNSKKISFHGTVVDKHSIGGIGGDKTTMLLVPIIAAAGLKMPKTSSRAITSPAGTADRMEMLAPVEHDISEIKRIVKKCNGCIVWGGAVNLAPADDLFIQIENPLNIDPLLLPSVISKKKTVGSRYVVIDIPVGAEAKVKNKDDAELLASKFIEMGRHFNMKIDCAITRGDQPIGYALGPALEAREALEVIMGRKSVPDLVDKVTTIAGMLLGMVRKGNKKTAESLLESGKAEKRLREIIDAQGGDKNIMPDDIELAEYKACLRSKYSGMIEGISIHNVVNAAKRAGAPKYKKAGVVLNKKIGDSVKKGEVLFTVCAGKRRKLDRALNIAKESDIFTIRKAGTVYRKILVEEV